MSRQTNRCDIKKCTLKGMCSQCLMKRGSPTGPGGGLLNPELSASLRAPRAPCCPQGPSPPCWWGSLPPPPWLVPCPSAPGSAPAGLTSRRLAHPEDSAHPCLCMCALGLNFLLFVFLPGGRDVTSSRKPCGEARVTPDAALRFCFSRIQQTLRETCAPHAPSGAGPASRMAHPGSQATLGCQCRTRAPAGGPGRQKASLARRPHGLRAQAAVFTGQDLRWDKLSWGMSY